MDRRIKKTRDAIFAAFEELLAEKRYEQITVSDIIDRANIGRSTFYAHFETKDALFMATCDELFAHIFEPHGREHSHDFSEDHGLRARLTHILYHLKDDRDRYTRIFSCESADLFWSYFKKQVAVIAAQKKAPAGSLPQELPEDFYINFYCSAFMEAVKWWFGTGLTATPEELEGYFEAVTG